jgi:hypothetical protein
LGFSDHEVNGIALRAALDPKFDGVLPFGQTKGDLADCYPSTPSCRLYDRRACSVVTNASLNGIGRQAFPVTLEKNGNIFVAVEGKVLSTCDAV